MWDRVPGGFQDAGWVELDENGWSALIGWAAGAGNLRRDAVDDSGRTVSTSKTRSGVTIHRKEAFTETDRAMVDEDANTYLEDAGVARRPGGYRWFIRLPAQFSTWEQFRGAVTGAVHAQAPNASHPAEIAPVMQRVVKDLYRSGLMS